MDSRAEDCAFAERRMNLVQSFKAGYKSSIIELVALATTEFQLEDLTSWPTSTPHSTTIYFFGQEL